MRYSLPPSSRNFNIRQFASGAGLKITHEAIFLKTLTVAAMAIRRSLTLARRNTRDVQSTGVMIVDPWQAR
jgi:hypothetical protein